MPTVLITGANRGLGLEFARQYSQEGFRVLALARNPQQSPALSEMTQSNPNVVVHSLDVTNHGQVDALAKSLKDEPIDILLNNAGVYGDRLAGEAMRFGSLNYDRWHETMAVNVFGPTKLCEAFVEHLAASPKPKHVIVTSRMGSIGDNGRGGSYLYRSSKAAVNAVGKSLAIDLADRNIMTILLHPGWVRTDMGTEIAPLEVEESITQMRQLIAGLQREDSGRFWAFDGEELPW